MKPAFIAIQSGYPSTLEVPRAALFQEIGWSDLVNNFNYTNTCAIRVSVALLKAGVAFPGRMRINTGRFKGRRIEPGQGRLSLVLARLWGAPEKYQGGAAAEKAIGGRKGVVSFWRLHPNLGDTQGHIDIVSGHVGELKCGNACYWGSSEVWFWPLK
jgi:hypothetical protein